MDVRKLIKQYGKDRVSGALECEVQDAKRVEADLINEMGPEEQIRYLIEEAGYEAEAIARIVSEYED